MIALLILMPGLWLQAFSQCSTDYPILEDIVTSKEKVFKADIAILIDESGSINADDYRKEIEFCINLVLAFKVAASETRIALIWFDDTAMMELHWLNGTNTTIVTDTLTSKRQRGGFTNFVQPLRLVFDKLLPESFSLRPDARKIVVLITGGKSGGDANDVAKHMRDKGVIVFAVGVGQGFNSQALVQITENPAHVISTQSFDTLKNKLGQLKEEITQEHTCRFTYRPTCRCYYNASEACIQEANLEIFQRPNSTKGDHACEQSNQITLECDERECEKFCDTWSWAPWSICEDGKKKRERNNALRSGDRRWNCNRTQVAECKSASLVATPATPATTMVTKADEREFRVLSFMCPPSNVQKGYAWTTEFSIYIIVGALILFVGVGVGLAIARIFWKRLSKSHTFHLNDIIADTAN